MALHVKYDPDTGEIVSPLKPGEKVYEFDITQEQFDAGVTLQRHRKAGHPAAIRLADDTIVEENWP